MDGCIDVPKKFFEAAEEETWWETFECLLEFEDKEPHLRFPAPQVELQQMNSAAS